MRRSALALGGLLMPMQAASALLLPATRHVAARGLSRMVPPSTFRALSMGAASAEGQEALDFDNTRLYPQPPIVAEGMLKVSELHTVAWYEYGNPAGKPVLFVHGGPGGGTAPMNARYFDPALYRIILVDQRGCGKSTLFAELEENTTPDLVSDFEKVRQLLAIDTWQANPKPNPKPKPSPNPNPNPNPNLKPKPSPNPTLIGTRVRSSAVAGALRWRSRTRWRTRRA